jgi:hypothetical protein
VVANQLLQKIKKAPHLRCNCWLGRSDFQDRLLTLKRDGVWAGQRGERITKHVVSRAEGGGRGRKGATDGQNGHGKGSAGGAIAPPVDGRAGKGWEGPTVVRKHDDGCSPSEINLEKIKYIVHSKNRYNCSKILIKNSRTHQQIRLLPVNYIYI